MQDLKKKKAMNMNIEERKFKSKGKKPLENLFDDNTSSKINK